MAVLNRSVAALIPKAMTLAAAAMTRNIFQRRTHQTVKPAVTVGQMTTTTLSRVVQTRTC